ncbi:glucose/arabinose dehydrogenase [Catalinimonas alkaloidigena]|uniref:PQQ-dependent sugar dehydrogenase n=1 Tax=Catalinimonas alkaloidigena TaxID=1075417 RepID=UPI002406B097|nr:PQQ-dependent sugar dehydrogenase [Catalinimonas alkaloidigena]MDF9800958.1 glucose/arabinose dehydrogenase [Catalinimonas alkaloidigena]
MKKCATTYSVLVFLSSFYLFSCNSESTEKSAYLQDAEAIQHGEELFSQYCASCHNFDQALIGPNLSGVTTEAGHEWLSKFIVNAPEVIQSGDPRAKELYEQYKQYMPAFTSLEEQEVEAILAYMNTYQEKPQETQSALTAANALEDPIAEKIPDSGLTLVMEKYLKAPPSADEGIRARINRMVAIAQNGNERMFINDLRGNLYEIIKGEFKVFLDMKAQIGESFMNHPGWGSGLAHFEFHPEFDQNGLFYTSHTEKPGSIPADFTYADSIKVTVQYVLTEWKMDDPTSKTFSGSKREVFRANMVTQVHGVQDINFNPTAKPGDDDYGLLYIGVGDGGAAFGRYPFIPHRKNAIWGTVLRIDPLGNNSKNGQYGIPSINPWVDDPDALGEILCYGFRNPHHFTWEPSGERMYVTDIGQHQIEEINIVVPGGDYGWPEREGTFMINTGGKADQVFPLPDNDPDKFIYPVVQYDHDEGNAIIGGVIYQGKAMPQLQGKFIFGDVVSGKVFFADPDELELGKQAPIHSLQLRLENESDTTSLQTLSGVQRVALRFGTDVDDELYLFTKSDGVIYKAVGCEGNEMASTE